MTIINNIVSKILVKDDNDVYSILTYLDIDEELSQEFVLNYINEIIKNNPILKQNFIQKNNDYILCDIVSFNINKCVTIKYSKKSNFNIYINSILNKHFTEYKFYMFVCIDKEQKKSRLYFKIHHAYVDGYKLINMLTEPLYTKKEDNKLPLFKRKTNLLSSIYYWIIGTITLIIKNLIVVSTLFLPNNNNNNNDNNDNINRSTDYIICKSFSLIKIKKFVEKRNISVNDFLYTLMIKTDNMYTKKDKLVQTCSPINVSDLNETNNMCPIFNIVHNSYNNDSLLKIVNTTFNNYKYSAFIPILSSIMKNIITHINIDILSNYYDKIMHKSDYIYSNIIGPPTDKLDLKISDIKFLTTAKSSEIIYNIISCKNKINIICSFKKGVIKNKKLFKKCIYKSYNNLMNYVPEDEDL